MNTPVHVALSLAVLGRTEQASKRDWLMIVMGAILPDALLFPLFYVREVSGGWLFEMAVKFSDLANSLPLYALLLLLALSARIRWLTLLTASALLHILCDIPLHNDDAHRHFYPLTDWVFVSPLSFWDAEHFGQVLGTAEGVLFIVCFYLIWKRVTSWWGKGLMISFGVVYVFTFIHFLGHAFASTHWAVW